MRTGYLQRYSAGNAPKEYDVQFLRQELQRIQDALNSIADGQLDETTVAQAKPRDGMIRYADGTGWNPGSGEGFYGYYAAAWHFLG